MPRLNRFPAEHRIDKPRAQRLITEKSAARILQKLRRAGKDDLQPRRLALKRVVENGKDLLIIVFSGHAVRNLIKIDAFVDEYDKPAVSEPADKNRHQLDIVVPVLIVDDAGHQKRRARLGFRTELPAQPAQAVALTSLVRRAPRAVIGIDYPCEIECADARFDLTQHGINPLGNLLLEIGRIRRQSRFRHLILNVGEPLGNNLGQRSALWRRLGRQVFHQLSVGRKPAAVRGGEPALRRKIGVRTDKAALDRIAAHQLNEKALAASVFADDKARRRASVRYRVEVPAERGDLPRPSDRDIFRAGARNNARRHGREQRV